MQQQEHELRLRHYERSIEIERKKAEADKEERRLEIGLRKGISRTTGSQAK